MNLPIYFFFSYLSGTVCFLSFHLVFVSKICKDLQNAAGQAGGIVIRDALFHTSYLLSLILHSGIKCTAFKLVESLIKEEITMTMVNSITKSHP